MSWQRVIVVGLIACLVGCAPPPVVPKQPEPPTLEVPAASADEPWRLPRLTLRAAAGDDTVVQLFVSADCSGPELLRRPIEAFRAGVELDAVSGRNVFTATALTRAGLRSRCSQVVSVEVRLPMRGQVSAPEVLDTSVRSPTKERSVTLTGFAQDGWTVRVWSKRDCEGLVLASGEASAFAEPGLEVPLQANEHLDVSLDATRGYELTRCSASTRLENDSRPPAFGPEFFPRPPHPFGVNAMLVPSLELGATVRLTGGPQCGGADTRPIGTSYCENDSCDWVLFPLPTDATFSLWATDFAGNDSTCLTFQQQLAPQAPLPITPLWRRLRSGYLVVASPVEFKAQVFGTLDCSGPGVSGNSTTVGDLHVFVSRDPLYPLSARLSSPPGEGAFPCVMLQ